MENRKKGRTGCLSVITADMAKSKFHEKLVEKIFQSSPLDPNGDPDRFFCESVVIKEGVWNGFLETGEVLKQASGSLLGKYVLLDHPLEGSEPGWPETAMGQVISVDVSLDYEISCICEMWKKRIPPELFQKLINGEKVGVSVGFSQYSTDESGIWKNKEYVARSSKIYYTHIAIVPLGACTIEDGCAINLLTNMAQSASEGDNDIQSKEPETDKTNAENAFQNPKSSSEEFKDHCNNKENKNLNEIGDAKMAEDESIKQENKESAVPSNGAKTEYQFPVVSQSQDGKINIQWNSTADPSVIEKAKSELETVFGGLINQMSEITQTGKVADQIARDLLTGTLKSKLPHLSEDSMKKYMEMPINSLASIVADLTQMPSAPAESAIETQAPKAENKIAVKEIAQPEAHGQTQINLQQIKKKGKITYLEAAARIKKETGISI